MRRRREASPRLVVYIYTSEVVEMREGEELKRRSARGKTGWSLMRTSPSGEWRVATRKSSVPRVAGCGGGGAEVHGRRIWRVGHRLVPGGLVVSVGRAVVTGGLKGPRPSRGPGRWGPRCRQRGFCFLTRARGISCGTGCCGCGAANHVVGR
jgi:hypothetical protein